MRTALSNGPKRKHNVDLCNFFLSERITLKNNIYGKKQTYRTLEYYLLPF